MPTSAATVVAVDAELGVVIVGANGGDAKAPGENNANAPPEVKDRGDKSAAEAGEPCNAGDCKKSGIASTVVPVDADEAGEPVNEVEEDPECTESTLARVLDPSWLFAKYAASGERFLAGVLL